MQVVGLVVDHDDPPAARQLHQQRIGGRQACGRHRAEQCGDRVPVWSGTALVQGLHVGQRQHAGCLLRHRVVAQADAQVEVGPPLGRHHGVAAEDRAALEVGPQPLVDDQVRGDHQRCRRDVVRLVAERPEIGPGDRQAHDLGLARAGRRLDHVPGVGLGRHWNCRAGEPGHHLGQHAGAGDLVQVDQSLDGFALGEVIAERVAVGRLVLVEEPVFEQPPRGVADAGIVLRPPRVDLGADAGDQRGVAVPPAAGDGERVAHRLAPTGTSTGTAVVVSLPKMSTTLTSTVCRPGSSYSWWALRSSCRLARVR